MLKGEKWQKDIPEYQPGDRIYKLFNHNKIRVRGNEEEFLIKVIKVKENK